jgi:hypothetical protein
MKLNFKAGFAVLLGLFSARLIFHLARWNYNSFNGPFDLWKLAIEYGVPIAATLIWLWIIQMIFKPRNK